MVHRGWVPMMRAGWISTLRRRAIPTMRQGSVSMMRPGAWMALGALCLLGCREATSPFVSVDRPSIEVTGPLQLTFSGLDERTPVWLGPDSLAYVAEGVAPFAQGPGVLMKIPATGGAAEPLLPALQFPGGASHWLASPAPSPDGVRAAYVEMWAVADEDLCPAAVVVCDPSGAPPVAASLAEIRLHLMDREGGGSSAPGRSLAVPLEGREFVPLRGDPFLPGFFRIRYYPFQRLFHQENPPLFRPSWDPDGTRVAFSDGLQVLLWDLDSSHAEAVPGTGGGVAPAWSPNGEWIAFTRLVRGDSAAASCTHSGFLGPVCRQERVDYEVRDRTIALVRAGWFGNPRARPGGGARLDARLEPARLPAGWTTVDRPRGRGAGDSDSRHRTGPRARGFARWQPAGVRPAAERRQARSLGRPAGRRRVVNAGWGRGP